MVTVTYEDYTIRFGNGVSEEDFARVLISAQERLDSLTLNRWRGEDMGYKSERVKACLLALVNEMTGMEENGALKSVSNDGYSETYLTEEEKERKLNSLVTKLLSGTGLMGCL